MRVYMYRVRTANIYVLHTTCNTLHTQGLIKLRRVFTPDGNLLTTRKTIINFLQCDLMMF